LQFRIPWRKSFHSRPKPTYDAVHMRSVALPGIENDVMVQLPQLVQHLIFASGLSYLCPPSLSLSGSALVMEVMLWSEAVCLFCFTSVMFNVLYRPLWGVWQDFPLPQILSAAFRASTAAPPPLPIVPVLFAPVREQTDKTRIETKKQNNYPWSSLPSSWLGEGAATFFNLSDPSIPKELENVWCNRFLPKQAGDLYHLRAPPSQLPTPLSPQIINLGLPRRALFKEMLSGKWGGWALLK